MMPFQKGNKLTPKMTDSRRINIGLGNKGKLKGKNHPNDCLHCLAVKTGNKFNRKIWQVEYHKRKRLKKFGLTKNQYDQMLTNQGGVCAICDNKSGGRWGTMSIDHNHKTGEVRGLLCMTCNTMLGRLEKRMERTLLYLGINYE